MKSRSNSVFLIFVLLSLAVGLVVLALGGYLAPVSRLLINPVIGAQTWLSLRFHAFQTLLSSPQDLTILQQRNTELEAEVSRLQTEIIELKQQIAETRILSALVDFARVNPEYSYVAAAVIGRDPSPFVNYVIINRGSDDGLRRGMPVVTQQGLVGRVAAVTSGAARVQLITDPASILNVRLEPSRAQATLIGDITGELALGMVPQSVVVQLGDLVLTSGLGGNYPPNILIGQVTSIRKLETDLFQSGVVQAVVDFNNLEIVLIIINFTPVDVNPLIPTPPVP